MKSFVAKTLVAALLCVGVLASPQFAVAQTPSPVAPTLIPVTGRLSNADGSPRTGPVSLILALYNTQADVAARWVEQQDVMLDATGVYSVQFGATMPDGLPADLFATEGGARWLGVAVRETTGDVEQPRVMLVSVPYAAKAASAETLGGKSASDFVLSSTFRDDLRTVLQEEGVTANGEVGSEAVTLNYLQKGDGAGGTTDSALFETGGLVGVNTTSPAYALDVRTPAGASGLRVRGENTGGTSNIFLETTAAAGGTVRNWLITTNYDIAGDFALRESNVQGGSAYGAGTTRFVIRRGGYTGIGTPHPFFRLDIRETLNGAAALRLNADNSGGSAAMLFDTTAASGGNVRNWALATNYGAVGDFVIREGIAEGANAFLGGTTRFTIRSGGNVGIGTTNPTAKLHVAGDVIVDGNIGAKYQDVAEWVPSSEPLEAGTLVVIDTDSMNTVKAARSAYDSRVAGAVSPQPGLILGEAGEGKVLVAQSGRVRVKADARSGAIKPGDLLVSSGTTGHVMKSKPVKIGGHEVHRPGTVVGKALEGLDKGQGDILVLLTLQ